MKSRIHQLLTTHWGYTSFRPLQEEIILSILDGNDTLAMMPTGGGKSICFQIPALVQEGICIVISPLISLIKDQVDALKAKGIPALTVVSGMRKSEVDIALDNCIYGNIKFLYVTPERLSSELFLMRLEKMKVNLIAVDEAHCISQWGYDFRPSYLKLASIREILPDVPVLALTATAIAYVEKDIQKKLLFKKAAVFKKSFERENLSYVASQDENKMQRLLTIIQNVKGSGIIYVRNRKRTKEIAEALQKHKIKAAFYHAGLKSDVRNNVQSDWMNETIQVIVSTNAFGMGIDKSNVRFVVHLDLPDSPEAYFQEAGRAGRDGMKAYAVILYNDSDIEELKINFERSFPETKNVLRVYTALANFFQIPVGAGKDMSYNFEIDEFCFNYDIPSHLALSSLKVLELQGLLSLSDSANLYSRIHFLSRSDDLYEFQVRNPKFDHLIKTILRSYSGMFNNYIEVSEQTIAMRAGISKDELVKNLEMLNQLRVISYLPTTDHPQITYLEERLDERDIRIDREHLADRKDRQLKRIKAMIRYATNQSRCRSQMLLEYFGEEKDQRCAVCDNCLKRNKLRMTDLEFEAIESQIKSILMAHPVKLEELIKRINPDGIRAKEEFQLKVLRWLMDNEKVEYEGLIFLKWVE